MGNINEKMMGLGKQPSVIRDLFEYGNRRAAEIGRENIFDFSLGNPSVPAPACVDENIIRLIQTEDSIVLHGYTSGVGDAHVRELIAENIKERFGYDAKPSQLYMTCGAAASLTICLNAVVTDPSDEVIAIAPFFPEYRVFAEKAGAKFVIVPADEEKFQINFDALEDILNENTKAIIVNSPNNPSGAILTSDTIDRLCGMLRRAEEKYGHVIYLIADEPYRELVYDDTAVIPYLPNIYDDCFVCYSFSKSLSLPGDRIGYILVSGKMKDDRDVYAAVCGAGRSLGYVCAPALMQRVVAACLGQTSDIEAYRTNRDLLYDALTELGFECVHPDGAFYLFVKAPGGDGKALSEAAKKYELLIVPSDSFGCEGYVRLSYCVSKEMILRSLPAFEKLAREIF